jgi:hypothetical protein
MHYTLQVQSVMLAKRDEANRRVQGVRVQLRQEFPADLYR